MTGFYELKESIISLMDIVKAITKQLSTYMKKNYLSSHILELEVIHTLWRRHALKAKKITGYELLKLVKIRGNIE